MEMVQTTEQQRYWWRGNRKTKDVCEVGNRPGHVCPQCGEGILAYDGLFMLTCPACGHIAESGAFT